MMRVAGIDACPAGWFAVVCDGQGNWTCEIHENAQALWERNRHLFLILIDIPIGLPFEVKRQCDSEARKILGRRASSVFPAPSREAVRAKTYEEACLRNMEVLGKKISRQTWNISPKIRQVDDLLQSDLSARATLRESHPEIAFGTLNTGAVLFHSKKTPAGLGERLRILAAHHSQAEKIMNHAAQTFSRKVLGLDDILDALCLAVTAMQPPESLVTLPEFPPLDKLGLPMEIVYSNTFMHTALRGSDPKNSPLH
ncbi:MAG: DUF429 domain-containing protein [Candidatus Zhuqueibacterota bacterium]